MTDDAKTIRDVLDWYREQHPNKTIRATRLSQLLAGDTRLRNAVARHLIATDPEAVRIPLKGTVS